MALDNEPEEGISFMGLFGMNVSKLQNHEYNAKVGATMGIRADYMLPNAHGTYLTAGVDWTMKGGKLSYSEMVGTTNVDATAKYALHYFEVPIRVGFRYNASDELGLYGEVGPYFAVGVGGKHKVKLDMDGDAANQIEDAGTYKAFRNYGYPDKTFQRWDAGIGFRVGAEYNEHYNLMLGCDWGLADIYRNSLRDDFYDNTGTSLPKVHNFNFSITLGYRF
jgi:hypothetical protein